MKIRVYSCNSLPLLSFFIFIFTTGLTQAQDVFSYPLTTQTDEAFRATCAQLAQHKFTKGNFEHEKNITRLERTLKSSGNFIIAFDLGMVWDTVKPFPSTLALGRDFMIQSRSGRHKTVLNAQGNETFLRMAEVNSAIFSGNTKALIDNFTIYYSGSVSAWELGLIPFDKTIASITQKIYIKGDAVIRSIQITEQSGDTIKYNLSNHSFPAELSANEKAYFAIP